MARLRRVVVPELPHHVVQRGDRRLKIFFSKSDFIAYVLLMAEWAPRCGVTILVYCLMPNHVHLILIPEREDSIARFMQRVHRALALRINKRFGWAGTICQRRHWSCTLDDRHLLAAVRYVLLNPVRAHLVSKAEDWPYSSVRTHLHGESDPVVSVGCLDGLVDDWQAYLEGPGDTEAELRFEKHLGCWLPLGSDSFIDDLEIRLGRPLRRRKPGPKPKTSPIINPADPS